MSSFVRPELRKKLGRWAEPAIAVLLGLIGLRFLWRGLARYDWMGQALGVILIAFAAAMFWAAYRRVQFRQDANGPGLVEVHERRISYLSAVGGGSVDLEAMTRLELRSMLEQGRVWVLKQSEGPTLFIPVNAAGAEKLFDAFSVLPGIDPARLVAALKSGSDHRDVIWRGAPGFRALT